MKTVAIIVLNWQQAQLTIDTIESIKKIKHAGFIYHIFLVDNGSKDDCVEIFKQKYSSDALISIHQTGHNLGYVGGNNFGIKLALKQKFSHILIANNDILVDPEFLSKLLAGSQKYPQAILTPKIYFAPGFEYFKDRYSKSEIGRVIWSIGGQMDWNNIYGSNLGIDEVDVGQYDKTSPEMDFISGCCILIPRQVFKKIGSFDEKYFLYLEDADFCQRAKRAGYQLKLIASSKIWHINSGSSHPNSSLQDYFITRNRLLFGFRYASLRTKFALFRESIRFILNGSDWRKKAVRDFYLHHFGKGSWQ